MIPLELREVLVAVTWAAMLGLVVGYRLGRLDVLDELWERIKEEK